MLPLTTSIDEAYELGMITGWTRRFCRQNDITTILHIVAIHTEFLPYIHGCGDSIYAELMGIINRYAPLLPPPPEKYIPSPPKMIMLQDKLNILSFQERRRLNKWITDRFKLLDKQVRVAFKILGKADNAIKAALSTDDLNLLSLNCRNLDNEKAIIRYLKAVRETIESSTAHIKLSLKPKWLYMAMDLNKAYLFDDIPRIDPDEKYIHAIINSYGFLSKKEKATLTEFAVTHEGNIPYLYIAKLFILRLSGRNGAILTDYYGIGPSGLRASIQDLAVRYKLSEAYIRQITVDRPTLPLYLNNKVHDYLHGLLKSITALEDPVWDRIQQENMLDEPLRDTVFLVCCLDGRYRLGRLESDDTKYLIDKEIFRHFDINGIFCDIRYEARCMDEDSEPLDILEYITPADLISHRNARELCSVYARALRKIRNLTVIHDRYVMPPAYIPEEDDAGDMMIPTWD